MDEINVNEIDTSVDMPQVTPVESRKQSKKKIEQPTTTPVEHKLVNCLRNVKVKVRHINKQTGLVSNPKHVLYGGMAETALRVLTVPMTASGRYAVIMTDEERECIENALGLPYNALNPYAINDNFWDDDKEDGINQVTLTKQDTILDLSNPEDFIKYKILLANKNLVAPSLAALQTTPKASYQFVIVEDGEEAKTAKSNMNATMECYKEYGKFEDDIDKLRFIIETMDGRPTSPNSKLEFLQAKINELIQSNAKTFLSIIKDKYVDFKVIIKKAVDAGIIANRAGFFYIKADNTALCELNEEPNLVFAAKYLANPRHQDVLFTIQAKLKQ
jgi:hypothetical protein